MSSDFAILTDSKCLLCHQVEGRGAWQLCDRCRAELHVGRQRGELACRPGRYRMLRTKANGT